MKSKKGRKKIRSRSLKKKNPLKRKSRSSLKKKNSLRRRSRSSLKKKNPLRRRSRSSLKKKKNIDGGLDYEQSLNSLKEEINLINQKIKESEESVISKFPRITASVVQIVGYFKESDPFSPHVNNNEQKGKGSGFIIDIKNGLLLTNAHVVRNSIYLYALTEKFRQKQIELSVISLCDEKDVALCKIVNEEDRKSLQDGKDPDDINMKFTDSFNLKHLDKVFVIGYPLGLENIKATGGTITGFYSNNEEDGDIFDVEDTSSYIETSAPINPGNSGGPLINMNGEVIGIVSAGRSFVGFMRIAQNVNYAVGSRTILSIFGELSKSLSEEKNKVVVPARYGFRYNKTSKNHLEKIGCTKEGIYISKIFPDGSFKDKLKEGDILCKISFNDIYKNKECFSIIDKCQDNENNEVSYEIKSDGFLVNKDYDRKFVLKELFDSIPIGTKLKFEIFREGKLDTVEGEFNNNNDVYRNKIVLSGFTPYKFVISHGLCIGELTLNHVLYDQSLIKFVENENRYKRFLIINWVFPQTEASKLDMKKGTVISKINGEKFDKIDDGLKKILESTSLEIITADNDKFVIKKDDKETTRIKYHVNNNIEII